jgi:hypothetical protein
MARLSTADSRPDRSLTDLGLTANGCGKDFTKCTKCTKCMYKVYIVIIDDIEGARWGAVDVRSKKRTVWDRLFRLCPNFGQHPPLISKMRTFYKNRAPWYHFH